MVCIFYAILIAYVQKNKLYQPKITLEISKNKTQEWLKYFDKIPFSKHIVK